MKVTQEQALEALERMRRNALYGISSGDYEIMNPDGYAVDMDTHLEDVQTLRQFIEGQGWKPIETAPMDGTKVLITNGRWVYTAKWKSDCQHGGFEERVGWQIFDCEDPYYSVAAENHEITHWKPISPPSGEE